MIVLGFAPLVYLALKDVGGWSALKDKLAAVAVEQHFDAGAWTHSWTHMGSALENPMGIGWFGMVAGLGFDSFLSATGALTFWLYNAPWRRIPWRRRGGRR